MSTLNRANAHQETSNNAELRAAITRIDSLNQDGCNSTRAICSVILTALESPEGVNRVVLHRLIQIINTTAEQQQDSITLEIDELNCLHINQSEQRLFAAMSRGVK